MWTQPDRTKKQKYGVICRSLASDQFLGRKLKAIDTGGKGSINQGIHADYIVVF